MILSQFRSLMMALQVPASEARVKVEPWIVNSTAFANKVGTSYGYSVLNGEEIPDELIKVIHLSEGNHIGKRRISAVKADLTAVRTGSGQTFKGRSPVLQII